ncbi:MAG TPA: ribonuclease D [Xanthomonadaceae bacterium]|nr:ribonuclease D [Xanthomonadaceae bacterium]
MQQYLDEPESLVEFLEQRRNGTALAMDTEFMRVRTFYPRLALIQIGFNGHIGLLDPIALPRPESFLALLTDPSVDKVLHSASEDLEALRCGFGVLPDPLLDTQIAAGLAGYGFSLSYAALVHSLLDCHVDKGETRSDWLQRPLSDAQIHYAAEDVRHLPEVARILCDRLTDLGRMDWLREDCARMVALAREPGCDPQPHHAFRNLHRSPEIVQKRLRRILLWREREARERDCPRMWLLDNPTAQDLASKPPADLRALSQRMRPLWRSPKAAWPALWDALGDDSLDGDWEPAPPPLDDDQRALLKRLQEAVRSLAEAMAIPEPLLASKRHLEALASSPGWPEALQGWRQKALEPALGPLLG